MTEIGRGISLQWRRSICSLELQTLDLVPYSSEMLSFGDPIQCGLSSDWKTAYTETENSSSSSTVVVAVVVAVVIVVVSDCRVLC